MCLQNFKVFRVQVISIRLAQEAEFFSSWTRSYHSQGSHTRDPVTVFPLDPPPASRDLFWNGEVRFKVVEQSVRPGYAAVSDDACRVGSLTVKLHKSYNL